MVIFMAFSLNFPTSIDAEIAARCRRLRLQKAWTRDFLASRSGVSASMIKKFESTGRITLRQLLMLARALDARTGWDQLFKVDPLDGMSLADVAKLEPTNRQRGRRRPRSTP